MLIHGSRRASSGLSGLLSDGSPPRLEKFRFRRRSGATNLRRPRATLAQKVVPSFSMASFAMKPGHRRRAHEFITWPAFRIQRNISDRTLVFLFVLGFLISPQPHSRCCVSCIPFALSPSFLFLLFAFKLLFFLFSLGKRRARKESMLGWCRWNSSSVVQIFETFGREWDFDLLN